MESIKSNELRIGNLVIAKNSFDKISETYIDKIRNVDAIFIDKVGFKSCSNHICILNYEPIPLTEEWLFKFGFEIDESNDNKKTKTLSTQVSNTESLYFDENEWYISHDWNNNNFKNTFWNQPKYVHQLQNIYFALTGEELTIK